MQETERQHFKSDHWIYIEKNARALSSGLNLLGIKTVYFLYDPNNILYRPDLGAAPYCEVFSGKNGRLLDRNMMLDFTCPMSANTLVAVKNKFSACKNQLFMRQIDIRPRPAIIISGVMYDCCVRDTALDFKHAGYEVIVATNATNAEFCSGISAWGVPSRKRAIKPINGVQNLNISQILSRFHESPMYSFYRKDLSHLNI